MKLLEKLAKDYYQERPDGFGDPREDFMAGFLAAREMAAKFILENGCGDDDPYVCMCSAIAEDVEKLGENEVP